MTVARGDSRRSVTAFAGMTALRGLRLSPSLEPRIGRGGVFGFAGTTDWRRLPFRFRWDDRLETAALSSSLERLKRRRFRLRWSNALEAPAFSCLRARCRCQ